MLTDGVYRFTVVLPRFHCTYDDTFLPYPFVDVTLSWVILLNIKLVDAVDLWVQGLPGLQNEFQDSQGYRETLSQKNKQKQNKQKNQTKTKKKGRWGNWAWYGSIPI